MEDALRRDGQALADELYTFLQSLDPARWRADLPATLAARFDALRERAQALQRELAAQALKRDGEDAAWVALRERMATLTEVFEDFETRRQSLALGLAAKRDQAAATVAATRDAAAAKVAATRDQAAATVAAKRDQAAATVATTKEAMAARGEAMRQEWAALGERLKPAYEHVAMTLRACHLEAPTLRPTNWRRSVFHVGMATFALVMLESVLSATGAIVVMSVLLGMAWATEIARRIWPKVNEVVYGALRGIAHAHEEHRVNSATWYVTALFLLAIGLPPMASALGVAALGFGDPMAATVGRRWGKHKLVGQRSAEGFAAFVVFGALAAGAALAVWHPEVGLAHGAALALAAATAGGLAELFSQRLDDNFTIPLAGAVAAFGAAALLGVL